MPNISFPSASNEIDLSSISVNDLADGQSIVQTLSDVYQRYPNQISGSGEYNEDYLQSLNYVMIDKQSAQSQMNLPTPEVGALHNIYVGENGDWMQIFYGMEFGTIWVRKHGVSTWGKWDKLYPKKSSTKVYSQVVTIDNSASIPSFNHVFTDLVEVPYRGYGANSGWSYKLLFKAAFTENDTPVNDGENVWSFLMNFKGVGTGSEKISIYSANVNAVHVAAVGEIPLIALVNHSSTLSAFKFQVKKFTSLPALPNPDMITGMVNGTIEFMSDIKLI